MAQRRWQRPPRLRWFLAAWGLFLLACFLPAITSTIAVFGEASPSSSRDSGVSCLLWSYIFFLGASSSPRTAGAESLFLGSMALPNTFLIVSPILAFRFPHRTFGAIAWIGAAMAVHVTSWFAFASLDRGYGSLVGAFAWAASFAGLAAAFFDSAARAVLPETAPANGVLP